MAVPSRQNQIQHFVMQGLILGYIYSVLLSASGIVVCEVRGKADCSAAWSQGYAVATGLVTTFLAYFVQPNLKLPTRPKSDEPTP